MSDDDTSATLCGTVEQMTYRNDDTGYTVLRLATADARSALTTAVGVMPELNVGESVELTGAWTAHPQYGAQFRAEQVRIVPPATTAGIERYLASGLIHGIGPQLAGRIVACFGLDTLRVLDEAPQRLREVPGIGAKRSAGIVQAWAEQRHMREALVFLQGYGVSTGLAVRIYKAYQEDTVALVRANPYRLARDIPGVGFLTADRIAGALGVPHDSPERVGAGLVHVLSRAAEDGHVYLPAGELAAAAAELLGVRPALAAEILDLAAIEGDVLYVADVPGAEGRAAYLPALCRAEVGLARRLRELVETPVERLNIGPEDAAALAAQTGAPGLTISARQLSAVTATLTRRLTVLTGGPGTGKTVSLQTVVAAAERAGKTVALAAPTGRAAKRLSEATGRPAQTVHRLLEVRPEAGLAAFDRHAGNPLEADLIIVDEASMLDLPLAHHLLAALPAGAHLLLVGDVDQLPSVEPGNVLHDVIAAIEQGPGVRGQKLGFRNSTDPCPLPPDACAVVRLDAIFRQPEGSYIISNAHRINRGDLPVLDNRAARDFFLFREEDANRAAALIVDLVQARIPQKFGLRPDQIQVLSPMHRGAAGVTELNLRLQAALNLPTPGKAERQQGARVLRAGDRVMQIRNNYAKDIFNGDVGRIVAVESEAQQVVVDFDGRLVDYSFAETDELTHAYAITIHKAQGSEFPAVVVPLLVGHHIMLQRNLLYTAVTRAQQLVVLVGSPQAIASAVRNNQAQRRCSGLVARLIGTPAAAGR
jgi:exodeoxyribonuclease V alpha subunit